jgi:hypothetical protein
VMLALPPSKAVRRNMNGQIIVSCACATVSNSVLETVFLLQYYLQYITAVFSFVFLRKLRGDLLKASHRIPVPSVVSLSGGCTPTSTLHFLSRLLHTEMCSATPSLQAYLVHLGLSILSDIDGLSPLGVVSHPCLEGLRTPVTS